MKNFLSILIKALLFLTLFLILLSSLGEYFISKKSGHKTWDSFYAQPDNSIDILFFGNSHIGNGIDLNIVSTKTKANVNTIYSSGKVLDQIYYSFKETLKYQTPKLIVIETFAIPSDSIFYFKNPIKENEVPFNAKIQSFDSKRISLIKLEEYRDIYANEEFLTTLFPLIRNHSNWSNKDFLRENLFTKYDPNNNQFYKGSSNSITMLSNKRVQGYKNKDFKKRTFKISERQRQYFHKIMDLANINGIEVMLFTIPYFKEYRKKIDYQSFHNEINELASKNNIKHLDLNTVFADWDQNFFSNEHVGHNQHVNYKGAIKTSNYLAKYINSNFNFNFSRSLALFPEYYLYNDIKRDSLYNGDRILGNLEKINGKKKLKLQIKQGESAVVLHGWTAIENQDSKYNEIFIGLKGKDNNIYVSKPTQFKPVERKDVSKYFKKEKIYNHTGFHININSLLLEKGNYRLFMIIRDTEGEVLIRDSKKSIEII